ncbi:flavodoxin family protein [Listeria grayi]|uniref:flavodoxin family protein n=1 Tax=Listeria grayi TaxID=1641 RepID=UPI0004AE47C7|nr:flavodoxin family protein [Listeria grayi]
MVKKVIGILGTTNKEGLTAEMLHAVLDGAAEAGNEVDCIYLADHDVKMNGPVINKISRQIEDADCIVLAAPTYWGGISGLAKNFFRCNAAEVCSDDEKRRRQADAL